MYVILNMHTGKEMKSDLGWRYKSLKTLDVPVKQELKRSTKGWSLLSMPYCGHYHLTQLAILTHRMTTHWIFLKLKRLFCMDISVDLIKLSTSNQPFSSHKLNPITLSF